jgi:hypothetical protein
LQQPDTKPDKFFVYAFHGIYVFITDMEQVYRIWLQECHHFPAWESRIWFGIFLICRQKFPSEAKSEMQTMLPEG